MEETVNKILDEFLTNFPIINNTESFKENFKKALQDVYNEGHNEGYIEGMCKGSGCDRDDIIVDDDFLY